MDNPVQLNVSFLATAIISPIVNSATATRFLPGVEESGYSIDYKPFVSIEKIESPEYLLNLTVYCARGIDITDVPVKDLAVLKMQLKNVNLRQSSQHLSKLLRDQERKSKKIVRVPHCIRVTKWSGKRYEDAYAYDPVTYNTIVD